MNEFVPSAQLEDSIRTAVAVPQALPEFVDQLYTELMHQASSKSRKALRPFYLRPAWIAVLAVITLLIVSTLIIGPQRVYAAVRQLFGYIPGVGIVDQSAPIRVLAERASVTRDGITVSVNQATLTADQLSAIGRVDVLISGLTSPHAGMTAANKKGINQAVQVTPKVFIPTFFDVDTAKLAAAQWAGCYRTEPTLTFSPAALPAKATVAFMGDAVSPALGTLLNVPACSF